MSPQCKYRTQLGLWFHKIKSLYFDSFYIRCVACYKEKNTDNSVGAQIDWDVCTAHEILAECSIAAKDTRYIGIIWS